MAQINWTNQALADLEAIGDFISRDAPSFAQVFVNRVFLSVERLENFPYSGRIVPEISQDTALPAVMQYSFLLTPLLSSLSAFRMYLIAAGSAVILERLSLVVIALFI
jgi:plasmid stabilization system protein ParE